MELHHLKKSTKFGDLCLMLHNKVYFDHYRITLSNHCDLLTAEMQSELNKLMDMGYPKHRAEKALAKTSYKGLQCAIEWLFAHQYDPDIEEDDSDRRREETLTAERNDEIRKEKEQLLKKVS